MNSASKRDVLVGLAALGLSGVGSGTAHAAQSAAPSKSIVLSGANVLYEVVARPTQILDPQGELLGEMFSFSYLGRAGGGSQRPVLFIYNGGPGSSSVWLHLGVFGPKSLVLDAEVNPSPAPPYRLRPNPDCLLDIADLVFVDPVGTGFSRLAGKGGQDDFFGVDADAIAFARFIEAWLTEHDRWDSPKILVGESYGTQRSAVLTRMLMGGPTYGGALHAITIDGVVLLGTTLESPDHGDADRNAAVLLPNMAATAWYHQRIDRKGRSLEAFVEDAEHFANTTFVEGLFAGAWGAEADRRRLAEQLSGFVGLAPEALLASNFRLGGPAYAKMLLSETHLETGLYDSRYTLAATTAPEDPVGDDPAMAQYTPIFVGAWHDYLTRDLQIQRPQPYGAIQWAGVNSRWTRTRNGVADGQSFAVDLALACRRNPKLRIFVGSGYYDLVTPFADAELSLRTAGVPRERVELKRYASGHMIYLGGTAPAFARDLRRFVSEVAR